jgi:putative component of membrane protein insertase Oxa1/YidC/SpoIIIJ protein YidD
MAESGSYGRATRWALRTIEWRRRGPLAGAGCCRFSPSCSHYAEELFRTRAFPVAAAKTILRIVRCNPLAVQHANDPVSRRRRWRFRPNTIPTVFAVFALSGIVVVTTAAMAEAVGVTGGCNVTIRNHDPATMTKDNPLTVHRGEVVSVTGQAPAAVQAAGGQIQTHTYVQVSFIEGLAEPKSEVDDGTGPTWGGHRNVDDFMDNAVGLYKVTGVSFGKGWRCDGSGYIKLSDGNPLSKPVGEAALGVAVVGAAGAALSARGGGDGDGSDAASESDAPPPPAAEDPDHEVTAEEYEEKHKITSTEILADQRANEQVDQDQAFGKRVWTGDFRGPATSASCLGLIVIAALVGSRNPWVFNMVTTAGARRPSDRRVWRHGHPVFGFISGLLFGAGLAVLGQQFAYWPLTRTTAIAFPVFVAILCSIRAYMGTPRKLVTR